MTSESISSRSASLILRETPVLGRGSYMMVVEVFLERIVRNCETSASSQYAAHFSPDLLMLTLDTSYTPLFSVT